MQNYIFKCFQTPKKNYIYDRHTNSVFSVPDSEFLDFQKIQNGQMKVAESQCFEKYQQLGVLQENIVEEVEHPETDYLEHHAMYRLSQLILQVTQQCNLRCGYCAYSGLYDNNRKHTRKRMTFETAKRAIDFFIQHTLELDKIHISFYGGEPLLAFELIKKCVAYAKESIEGKELTFGMTTNGTLLTDNIVNFLYENEFQLMISLDGSKEEHDASRKFASGEGSFDLIMSHIKRIKELFPEYKEKILFNTVVNPKANLGCVMDFFNTDDILADNHIIFNSVNPKGLRVNLDYDESFDLIRKYEYLKMLLMLIGKISQESISKLVLDSTIRKQEFYGTLNRHYPILKKFHHNGPCLPGIKRLFITVNGNFFPCEKVSENSACYGIGSLDTGFLWDKMKRFMNIGKLTKEECKECWNLQNCSICGEQFTLSEDDAESKKHKLQKCEEEKSRVFDDLYEICVLREFGYQPLERNEGVS